LPGVSQTDVDLRIEGDVLTIQGEKRNERRDTHAHVVERSYGSFQRSMQLPFSPDPEEVNANFDNGVLTITIPKKGQQEKAHRIRYAPPSLARRTSRAASPTQRRKKTRSRKQAPKDKAL
jgi:HSP20 family protein